MEAFAYREVQANRSAIEALATEPQARFLAGGTNLVDLMKMGIERPKTLVNINSLPLQSITVLPNGVLRIGALVRNSDLAYDERIRASYPVLSEALLSGASPQLRNMATVGGNLMQRTRCPYFYDVAFACNKRNNGSGCSALEGFNRGNAILGGSDHCISTHPSDMCVALAALDAIVQVEGPKGERSIRIQDFHLLPEDHPQKETDLGPAELITAVDLPNLPFAAKSHYVKVRDRASYEFALTSAAVALDIVDGTVRAARIALGGVGTKPWRSTVAEQLLMG
jgi:xanthine dehydrogenase YagS FAD-binding subunit